MMTKKPVNTVSASEKLKQSAKKLLGKVKKVGKLGAALPVAAIMVDEVRAAQIESLPNYELTGLDPFAQPEQPQELALEDLDTQQLAEVAEEGVDQALADLGVNANSGDLLLAQAEPSGTAASGVATDAGAASGVTGAGTSSSVAVATTEAFDLAGLPLVGVVGGPVGVFAAVAVGVVAADTGGNGATINEVNNGDGTQLATSLTDLAAQGVDAVNTSAGSLHVSAGNIAQLNPANAPLFGDANKDGVLSSPEDAALDVSLDLTSAGQISSLSNLSGLSNLATAGIDKVQFNFADQAALNEFVGNANLATELSSLTNAGLSFGGINMGNNAAQLTAAQHQILTDAGVQFAAGDDVLVDGTHLQTSVQDLQGLSVQSDSTDTVDVTPIATASLSINEGDASFAAMSEADINSLVSNLSDLGFADVNAISASGGAYAINNVAQTPVVSSVEAIGMDEAQVLVDIFGPDIANNKNS